MRWTPLLLYAFFLLAACASPVDKNEAKNVNVDHELVDMHVDFAQNFTLESIENGYILHLIDPNTLKTERTYTLTYDHSVEGENTIHLPCSRIANLSQTSVGMMSILGATNSITGISNINYVYDPKIIARFNKKQVAEFGDETNFPIEKIVASESRLILYSGFGKDFPQASKLTELGITPIPNYDWRETHPLGKAEWIKVIGILCGKEAAANSYFEKVKSSYLKLAQKAALVEHRPTVMSGNIYGSVWYSPAGESYMSMLFADAGADYVYRFTQGTGSIERGIEQILKDNLTTEFWMNPGDFSKARLLENAPQIKHLKAFESNTYCYTHNGNKFWERSASEPHLVLSDLLQLFHPELGGSDSLHFYQKIQP